MNILRNGPRMFFADPGLNAREGFTPIVSDTPVTAADLPKLRPGEYFDLHVKTNVRGETVTVAMIIVPPARTWWRPSTWTRPVQIAAVGLAHGVGRAAAIAAAKDAADRRFAGQLLTAAGR
ncbi:hypothetical protein [Agromyces sp. SYSU T00194]|uniref:hypothetical protein n=1 Tax=Agromyces chitinivorans TaxID=3158560 RepID=UPI00339A1FF8